jgi:hypothetical protein
VAAHAFPELVGLFAPWGAFVASQPSPPAGTFFIFIVVGASLGSVRCGKNLRFNSNGYTKGIAVNNIPVEDWNACMWEFGRDDLPEINARSTAV